MPLNVKKKLYALVTDAEIFLIIGLTKITNGEISNCIQITVDPTYVNTTFLNAFCLSGTTKNY